jgi:hypothetical protein
MTNRFQATKFRSNNMKTITIPLVLLVAAWSVNASWGPDFFKSTLMFKVGATAPVAP